MINDSPQAGWYQDPENAELARFWDGSAWTGQVASWRDVPSGSSQSEVLAPPQNSTQPAVSDPPSRAKGGLFGGKKALETELEDLRCFVDNFGFAERSALQAQIAQLQTQMESRRIEIREAEQELSVLNESLVRTREEVILQEVGLYDYRHRLEDSALYKDRIQSVRLRIREMSKKDGGAVHGSSNWQVNGSAAQGRKMVNEISKLLLRAYNGEADVLVNSMKPYKLDSAIDQLNKARSAIGRLGMTMSISITDAYHQLRLEELSLTADYLAKKEEEKEAEKAEKERLREEARALKEFEAAKEKLLKEKSHYATVLERIRAAGTPEEVAQAEQKLAEIEEAIHGVEEREANIRAGYVYVISNFGAFGRTVVKIGMTRRLEPMDRVRELGDASVPFNFDVHALIFSEDAVALEGRLHQALATRRLNLVNQRREFFYATPSEVKDLLTGEDGALLDFIEDPEASEWHQSENSRNGLVSRELSG
jgi:hypothetical protein